MDWKTLFIWLVSARIWGLAVSVPSTESFKGRHQDLFPVKTSSSSSSSKSSSSSSSFSSSTRKGKDGKKCCENGGLCVLGSFCHCPDNFYGYRCENGRKPCGPVQHGQWAKLGCHLCRCFDAGFHCFYRLYSGCDSDDRGEPMDKNRKIDVNDYLDDMTLFPQDDTSTDSSYNYDDDYYDDYEDGDSGTDRNNSATSLYCPSTCCDFVILIFVVFIIHSKFS